MQAQLGEELETQQHVQIGRRGRGRAPERGAPAETAAGDALADGRAEQRMGERIHGAVPASSGRGDIGQGRSSQPRRIVEQ